MSDTRVQTQLLSGKVFVLVGIFLWFVVGFFFFPNLFKVLEQQGKTTTTTLICSIICILQVLFPLLVSVFKSKLLGRETSE